jgi:hypothetical protein
MALALYILLLAPLMPSWTKELRRIHH